MTSLLKELFASPLEKVLAIEARRRAIFDAENAVHGMASELRDIAENSRVEPVREVQAGGDAGKVRLTFQNLVKATLEAERGIRLASEVSLHFRGAADALTSSDAGRKTMTQALASAKKALDGELDRLSAQLSDQLREEGVAATVADIEAAPAVARLRQRSEQITNALAQVANPGGVEFWSDALGCLTRD